MEKLTETFHLSDGASINYVDMGQGTPLLFVHGVMMSGRFFDEQLAHFSKTNRVIIPDLRGHGSSPAISTGHTVPQYARDVAELIDHLDLSNVTLIGWSMGAFVVWDYLDQFGAERIAKSVIIDEFPADFRWPDYEFGFADLPTLMGMMELIQTDYSAIVGQLIELMFKNRPADADIEWLTQEISSIEPSSASAIFFDQTMRDYRAILPRIDVPTLVCMGGDEKLIPVAAGQYIVDNLQQAELAVFDESCHCPFLEEAAAFNQKLERFIAT